jgi:hypothetical protein
VVRNLNAHGADGKALISVVAATSPQKPSGSSASQDRRPDTVAGGHGTDVSTEALSADGTRSPADAILAAAVGHGDGSGGLGIFLPGLMLAGVIAVVVRGLIRLRVRTRSA